MVRYILIYKKKVLVIMYDNGNYEYPNVKVAVKTGFGNDDNVSYYLPSAIDQKAVVSLEMDVLFYPVGQHLVSYVTGLGIEGGSMNIFYLEKSAFVAGGLEDEYSATSSPYASLYYYNGFSIEAGKNFGISFLLGLGPKKFLDVDKRTEFMVNFSFNLGYTF